MHGYTNCSVARAIGRAELLRGNVDRPRHVVWYVCNFRHPGFSNSSRSVTGAAALFGGSDGESTTECIAEMTLVAVTAL